jgi:hypothetical protein
VNPNSPWYGSKCSEKDRVLIANHVTGIVVFSIDTNEYPLEFPKKDWEHLGRGIMVQTENAELIFIEKLDDES